MNWGRRGRRRNASRKYTCPVSRCWQREQRDCAGRVSPIRLKLLISFRQSVLLLPRCSPQSETLLLRCSGAGRLLRGFEMLRLQKRNVCTTLQLFFLINPTFLQTWPVAVGERLLLHSQTLSHFLGTFFFFLPRLPFKNDYLCISHLLRQTV